MITCVSAAPSDPLEWSDLKLRRSTQVVMEGHADWGNAKPLRPSHPPDDSVPRPASLPVTAGACYSRGCCDNAVKAVRDKLSVGPELWTAVSDKGVIIMGVKTESGERGS